MRSSFKSLKEKQVPNRANRLDVFWTTDTHRLFVAIGDGEVMCLQDLITYGPAAKAIGPEGPAGPPCACKTGRDGRDGIDGKAGRDGINAVGAVGPTGRSGADGAPGKDAPQRVELDNLLIESRREIKKLRLEFAALQASFDGMVSMNQKSSEYLSWLRERAAARQQ